MSDCDYFARIKRIKEWQEKRTWAFNEVMKEYPEGITRDNLKSIQVKVKAKEQTPKGGEDE